MTKYSLETKLSAVTDYLNSVESFKDIAQKHCVDMTMLKKWVAKFQRHGLAGLQKTYTNYGSGAKI
ncbi:IS3 family transposase, partial [Bacillus pseudomycoides]